MVQVTSIRKLARCINDKIPARFNVGVMLFMTCFASYMLRVNISIIILGMIVPTTNTSMEVPDYGPRYEWSPSQQGLLLGGFFWGYFITTLPGGIMAEWIGPRMVIGIGLILSGMLTVLTPIAADISFWAMYATRIVTGLLGGVFFPGLHNLVAKWAPPDEKGKFVSALLGGALGTVVTLPLAGYLMETYGWKWAFYICAFITLLTAIAWFILVADAPAKHPRITVAERTYIEESLGNTVSVKKAIPPYVKFLTSLPFLSLMLLHYGNLWGLFFLMTAAPKFMSEVLRFNLAKTGILASLPSLARLLAGFVFGAIGDRLRRNGTMDLTLMRKFFCIFSHIIPGLLLISISYIGNYPGVCVAIITLSLGSNGASTITNLQNSQDLAPNFAGTLYSIINFVGTTSGFISPMVVSYFTREQSTIAEWNNIFIVGSILYILPAIIYWIFGSAKVQSWNELPNSDEKDVPPA